MLPARTVGSHSTSCVLFRPGFGDEFYPIAANRIQPACDSVGDLCAAWRQRIGADPIGPGPPFLAKPLFECDLSLGPGRCKVTMPHLHSSYNALRKRLNRWSLIEKFRPSTFDGVWSFLPVFYIGPSELGPGVDRGFLLLTLMQKADSQIYFTQTIDPPVVGDVLDLHPSVDNLKIHLQVVVLFPGGCSDVDVTEMSRFGCHLSSRPVPAPE